MLPPQRLCPESWRALEPLQGLIDGPRARRVLLFQLRSAADVGLGLGQVRAAGHLMAGHAPQIVVTGIVGIAVDGLAEALHRRAVILLPHVPEAFGIREIGPGAVSFTRPSGPL